MSNDSRLWSTGTSAACVRCREMHDQLLCGEMPPFCNRCAHEVVEDRGERIAALTSELAEARAERAMFCALVESLTSERDEARRQLGEAAKLLRDCPLGYANGALIHHRSTTAADVVAWLARAEEARTALASAAMAGGPHGAGEAK